MLCKWITLNSNMLEYIATGVIVSLLDFSGNQVCSCLVTLYIYYNQYVIVIIKITQFISAFIYVDGVYAYQVSFGLASGQVLCRSQGTLLPLSVNPRYRICGTMCNTRSNLISRKHFDLEKGFCIESMEKPRKPI
jgi:hypothetical protein